MSSKVSRDCAFQRLAMGKRSHVSKNKKRNWRKHVDIKEIEEHLEDERLQERTGGLVAEKSDAQLFFVDKAAPGEDSSNKPPGKKTAHSVRALKCHAGLLPDPNIKPARVAHNVRTATLKHLSSSKKLRLEAVTLTARQKVSVEHRSTALKRCQLNRRTKNHVNIASYDLWARDVDAVADDDGHYMKVTRKRRVNVPSHLRVKPSGLNSVELPHPGASYNPALWDYQQLLSKAHSVEVMKEKRELQVLRATDEKFPDKHEAPTEATYLNEMSAGLFEEKVASDEELGEQLSVNPPVRRENKKTIAQRNKEKRQKLQEKKAQQYKEERIKKNEMKRLKSCKKEVAKIELMRRERAARKADIKDRFKNKPKKLGRLKYEEPDLEVKLTDELQGSLRLLKPEGHLLEDRFKSLQRRNIIEPRKRAKRLRKYKLKEFEKKTHKEVIG